MSNQIEFRHLRYFLEVAKELHYRKAAEKLFISQPGLSKQIKQLEEELGVQLLERDKKKVQLTKGGAYLKTEAEYLLQYLKRTIKRLKLVAEGQIGEIRIGFVGSAMQTVIPKLIMKSSQKYPDIHFSLEEMSIRNQITALQNSTTDLGFVRLNRVPEGLQLKPVFKDHFSLVLPKDHPISNNNFKSVSQFKEAQFIFFSSDYSRVYYDQVMSICEDAGFSPIISHKSVHANTIFRLVESGLGIAIVPHSLSFGFDLGIKFIPLKNIRQEAVLSAVWKRDSRNPSLRNVLAFL